ncbi:hypothetical protein L0Y46_00875 [bacterium]|nr:hypothetical protein [bacterium]
MTFVTEGFYVWLVLAGVSWSYLASMYWWAKKKEKQGFDANDGANGDPMRSLVEFFFHYFAFSIFSVAAPLFSVLAFIAFFAK